MVGDNGFGFTESCGSTVSVYSPEDCTYSLIVASFTQRVKTWVPACVL